MLAAVSSRKAWSMHTCRSATNQATEAAAALQRQNTACLAKLKKYCVGEREPIRLRDNAGAFCHTLRQKQEFDYLEKKIFICVLWLVQVLWGNYIICTAFSSPENAVSDETVNPEKDSLKSIVSLMHAIAFQSLQNGLFRTQQFEWGEKTEHLQSVTWHRCIRGNKRESDQVKEIVLHVVIFKISIPRLLFHALSSRYLTFCGVFILCRNYETA